MDQPPRGVLDPRAHVRVRHSIGLPIFWLHAPCALFAVHHWVRVCSPSNGLGGFLIAEGEGHHCRKLAERRASYVCLGVHPRPRTPLYTYLAEFTPDTCFRTGGRCPKSSSAHHAWAATTLVAFRVA